MVQRVSGLLLGLGLGTTGEIFDGCAIGLDGMSGGRQSDGVLWPTSNTKINMGPSFRWGDGKDAAPIQQNTLLGVSEPR